jgi:hypothetical protein
MTIINIECVIDNIIDQVKLYDELICIINLMENPLKTKI